MNAIDKAFVIGFPFGNETKLQRIAEGFSRLSRNHMRNCVLAIDGWVCRTRQPFSNETPYPSSYRNRKDCFGIVILGIYHLC